MLVRAPILIAGKTSRTSLFASIAASTSLLLAVPALAQEVIDNVQVENGVITSTNTLNVVQNDGLSQAKSYATGNEMQGGNQDVDATVTSTQTVRGSIRASADILGQGTDADGRQSLGTPVYASSQATGNYTGFTTENARAQSTSTQTSTAPEIEAKTHVISLNNSIYVSGEAQASAEANHTAYEVRNGRLDAASWQSSDSDVKVNTSGEVHYSPSPNLYAAKAGQNYYGSYSEDRGSQEHEVHQTQSGQTNSRAELYGGNMWNVATESTTVANNVNLQNQGGSLVVTNDQHQVGAVLSQAVTHAYEYGEAHATATGIGNQVAAGNNDIYVRLDNTQISDGGVDVLAEFEGNTGYDAYISAEAYGNQALAYACADCRADMGVNSNQINNSDVNAVAKATVNGQGRSIVSSARAVGNSATYYVSGSR